MPIARRTDSIRVLATEARSDPLNVRWSYWLAFALVLVGALDAISTELALNTGGAREVNPVVRAMQEYMGGYWVIPKQAMHLVLGAMVLWYPNRLTLITMSIVALLVLAAVVNNFIIYSDIVRAL